MSKTQVKKLLVEVTITGKQGSGKTTLAKFVESMLRAYDLAMPDTHLTMLVKEVQKEEG